MCLCYDKLWKSYVNNIFGLTVKSYHMVLKFRDCALTNSSIGPKLEIFQTTNTCFIIIFIAHTTSYILEKNNSYWDTVTGTISSNDRLILC